MAFDLTGDGRRGVGGEGVPAIGVVPVDGFDQGQRCHLAQVVETFAAVLERAGQPVRQRQVEPHGLVTQPLAFLERASGPAQTADRLGRDVVRVVLLPRMTKPGTCGACRGFRVGKRCRHDVPQVGVGGARNGRHAVAAMEDPVSASIDTQAMHPGLPPPNKGNARRRPVTDLP
jgi:hypothetical protein